MLFVMAYQSSYCEYKWSQSKQERGLKTMCLKDKHKVNKNILQ